MTCTAESEFELVEFVPDIPTSDIKKVMDWIKAEVTLIKLPFCWKDTYGRGVGTIPGRVADCPPGYTNNGANCGSSIYSPSMTANCPDGFINHSIFGTFLLTNHLSCLWIPQSSVSWIRTTVLLTSLYSLSQVATGRTQPMEKDAVVPFLAAVATVNLATTMQVVSVREMQRTHASSNVPAGIPCMAKLAFVSNLVHLAIRG